MIIPNNMLGKSLHGPRFHGPALACLILVLHSLCKYQPYSTCLKRSLTALPSQTASAGKGDFGSERYALVWEQRQHTQGFAAGSLVLAGAVPGLLEERGKRTIRFYYILRKWGLLGGGGTSSAPGQPWVTFLHKFSLLLLEECQRPHIWEVWSSGEGCWCLNLKKYLAVPSQVDLQMVASQVCFGIGAGKVASSV